jgi:phospholipid-binding lipoprotein MlaA
VRILLLAVLFLGGCATIPAEQRHPGDPWERYNRAVFKFNDVLDKAVTKPIARGYQKITPDFIEARVSSFFSNLGEITNFVNNLLQGNFMNSGIDFSRFAVNSTFGLVGLFDIASRAGLEKHNEDFGQTLGVWGVGSGPYFMLPFLGPSTTRDSVGLVADYFTHPLSYVEHNLTRIPLTALLYTDLRSRALKVQDVLGSEFYDPYSSLRDYWLGHRKRLVSNGKAPDDAQPDDDLIQELEELEELEALDELDELDDLEESIN